MLVEEIVIIHEGFVSNGHMTPILLNLIPAKKRSVQERGVVPGITKSSIATQIALALGVQEDQVIVTEFHQKPDGSYIAKIYLAENKGFTAIISPDGNIRLPDIK